MPADDAKTTSEPLQFDRVVHDASSADPTAAQPTVACANCSTPIQTYYYHVNGHAVCARCRDIVAEQAKVPRGWGPLLRSIVLGVGAAIVAAIIYYGVIAITDFEIGIVAILTGYMIGYAVRKGAKGRGGRRFQIMAAVLTYWSVGLAYTPLAFKGMTDSQATKPAAAVADSTHDAASDSATASRTDSATVPATATAQQHTDDMSPVAAFSLLFVFVFALPLLAIVNTLPSGLLSAFIIFIGIHRAWRMTAAPPLHVSGPYRVGAHPSAATS